MSVKYQILPKFDTKKDSEQVSTNENKPPVSNLKKYLIALILLIICLYYTIKTNFYPFSLYHYSPQHHEKCHYRKEVYENVVSFSPDEQNSLDIYVSGVVENLDFKFAPTPKDTIQIISKFQLTSKHLNKEVANKTKDDTYYWSFEGPKFIKNHGQCATGSITVEIPDKIKAYESIRIVLPDAKVNINIKPQFAINYLYVKLHSGRLRVFNQIINKFIASLYHGNTRIDRVKSVYTYLASYSGDIDVVDSTIEEIHANSVNGHPYVTVENSEYVSLNTINGNVNARVVSIEEGRKNKLKAYLRTFKGNATLELPRDYEGTFTVASLSGNTEVNHKRKLRFTKNNKIFKSGYVGDHIQFGEVKSKTVNGYAKIKF